MKRIALLWLACGLAAHLCAEEPTPAPKLPPGPLLNKAPDFAQWTITSKNAGGVPEAAPTEVQPKGESSPSATPLHHRPKPGEASGKKPVALAEPTTVVTKTLSIRYEETNTSQGPRIRRWCVPDMQVTINGEGAPVVVTPKNTADSRYVDYSKSDFPGFEWIAESNFTGIKTVMDQECLVFQSQPAAKSQGDSEPIVPSMAVASINSATRLPVALQIENELQTYKFELAPTMMIVLPSEVASLIEQWRKTMEQSALMPAKP